MNRRDLSVKDWAKAVYEERIHYKEAKAFLGSSKLPELLEELSALHGCPVSDLGTPEGMERLEIFIYGKKNPN